MEGTNNEKKDENNKKEEVPRQNTTIGDGILGVRQAWYLKCDIF